MFGYLLWASEKQLLSSSLHVQSEVCEKYEGLLLIVVDKLTSNMLAGNVLVL